MNNLKSKLKLKRSKSNTNVSANQQAQQTSSENTNQQNFIEHTPFIKKVQLDYNLNNEFTNKLDLLYDIDKIVYILDDSSSMNILVENSLIAKQSNQVTRWEELKYFISRSIELTNLFSEAKSTDVYFLNQPPIFNIKNSQEFTESFDLIKPKGYTLLSSCLQNVIKDNIELLNDKKLLIVIVTDGMPTNEIGQADISSFYYALASRQPIERIFISIVCCSDDQKTFSYLNNWDKKIRNLDVVDDYNVVKNEIRKKRGDSYEFSFGDYLIKTLVGSFDASIDEMDEKKNKCTIF